MPDRRREARNRKQELGQGARRGLAQLGWQRVAVAALLTLVAVLIAAQSWNLPLLNDAERALYDKRAALASPLVDQDPRITVVVYTAETNRNSGQISPVDRTVLAKALQQLDTMGAKGIGIDILLDSPQDDDPLLQSTLKAMKTPVYLAYADSRNIGNSINYEQEQDLKGYLAAVKTAQVQPASILLEADSDGVARHWPATRPGLPPLLSLALAGRVPGDLDPRFKDYTGPIRYRMPASTDRPVFNKLPIDTLADPEVASFLTDQIQGRYILIGGDFADFDLWDTPLSQLRDPEKETPQMIGVEIHATMLAQMLDKALPAEVPGWAKWLAAIVAVGLGAATAFTQGRTWLLAIGVVVQFAIFIVAPFLLARSGVDTLELPSVGWVVGWILAYTAVSSALRAINAAQREFAQGALGKYLPRSVAAEIMKNPERLMLHGEKREIFCLFSDLEGFTKLTHAVEPEMIARLLNDYLDRLSAVVLEYGGTLDKFVGDAVVAFWGAPIAYPDDGERAVKAAWAMYLAGEEFRKAVPEGVPKIGRTRVGLHYGEAIVGNFGGEGRIQYTALGDAMNTAARLEGANKPLDTKVLISREAMERSGLDWFRPMGTITLRGRATPVEVFEPDPEATPEERKLSAEVIAAHEAGDSALVHRLTDNVVESGQDAALVNLIQRLRQTQKGESYVLG